MRRCSRCRAAPPALPLAANAAAAPARASALPGLTRPATALLNHLSMQWRCATICALSSGRKLSPVSHEAGHRGAFRINTFLARTDNRARKSVMRTALRLWASYAQPPSLAQGQACAWAQPHLRHKR